MYDATNLNPQQRDLEILSRLHHAHGTDARRLCKDLGCSMTAIQESVDSLRLRDFPVNLIRKTREVTIDRMGYERAEHLGAQHLERMLAGDS